jgi:hypothetical protein
MAGVNMAPPEIQSRTRVERCPEWRDTIWTF